MNYHIYILTRTKCTKSTQATRNWRSLMKKHRNKFTVNIISVAVRFLKGLIAHFYTIYTIHTIHIVFSNSIYKVQNGSIWLFSGTSIDLAQK